MDRQVTAFLMMLLISPLICPQSEQAHQVYAQRAGGDDEFLTSLYDTLHDSPMQRKIRDLAPVPFGVVFLPWKGMTEQEMREHFRLMKKLGFNNLKQTMPSSEWPAERILEIALEEDVIPFWYGEGGWEPITPELLRQLGLPEGLSRQEIRIHPKMKTYQKEVLRKQIHTGGGRTFLGEEEGAFQHTPDPHLRLSDVPHFKKWLRGNYRTPEELNQAWNLYEVGISPSPFESWDDVDGYLDRMAGESNDLRGYGREYGRLRDVLSYKADGRTAQVRAASQRAHQSDPLAPTRTGGEMGLFLPFAWRATKMEDLAETQAETGSFYPSIHFVWHFGEVQYEVARTIYMQSSFAADLFKGGWSGAWESTGGPQQLSGSKGWDYREQSTTPGFTVNAGTMTQLFLSYLAGGFRGAGVWAWNYRRAGIEAGEYALINRQMQPSDRAIRAGKIAQAAERLRDELWQAHKEPYVGVLINWDSDAMWAAVSLRNRDHYRHYPMKARVGISRALINANVPWEHVTIDDLSNGLAGRYKVIYLPAQLALTEKLLTMLTTFVEQGGRVVLDAPGGWYDEHGLVFNTGRGSKFEKLFGVEITDFQYSNNVPRLLNNQRMDGFILEVQPTRARTVHSFQTGEPAVTENVVGKGTAVILANDASFSCFQPGNAQMETHVVTSALGKWDSPYGCQGAVVYRLAAPEADHYFFINDDEARQVVLDTKKYRYVSASDPVSGETLPLGEHIELEAYSGRWLRLQK
jgi:beta-galactosidase